MAQALHWLTLALLAARFAIAWTMPDVRQGIGPMGLASLHLSLGTLILLPVILRLLWRPGHPPPAAGETMPPRQHRAAEAVHFLLHLVLILLPLLGWASASARGWSVSAFARLLRAPGSGRPARGSSPPSSVLAARPRALAYAALRLSATALSR